MPWVLYKYLDGEYFSQNLVLIPQARILHFRNGLELDTLSWDHLNVGLATTTMALLWPHIPMSQTRMVVVVSCFLITILAGRKVKILLQFILYHL